MNTAVNQASKLNTNWLKMNAIGNVNILLASTGFNWRAAKQSRPNTVWSV